MDNKEQAIEKLQWHPAFYAGLQIELQEDSDNLIFENEHQLGTKPKQIDALIIKKQKDIPIKKNIGKIFRKHNIVEYKSPTDYLCIDDYYKGYAYAMFYKSDTQKVDEIQISDITLTFVSTKYPQKFVDHLKTQWDYKFEQKYPGIYYIQKESDILPIQMIVTSKLKWEDNLWLRSLTNTLDDKNQIKKIVNEYHENKRNKLYESVMDI
ncbi:MAG: 3-isopropylmalate dehydrogenase, partial [Lachnospiraceae bacterium]|nr:3-isopropylmalate dehydrogenase [Lachnospiraceae bacterium]